MSAYPLSQVVIGWDVRGWMSNKQAVAVLAKNGQDLDWLGFADRFRLNLQTDSSLSSLLIPVRNGSALSAISDRTEVIVAIDAPLAFPLEFRALLNGHWSLVNPPKSEINNPFAYRACERWIYDEYGKRPLSASFDKLGNNAALAMSVASALRREEFSVVPQDGRLTRKSIIEVYPALAKVGMKRRNPAIPSLATMLPSELQPGTDIYDAAICALLGAVQMGWGREHGIPELVQPREGFDASEGWIYSLPSSYLNSFSAQPLPK
jgi:predicted nuclease with RNAse H fold